MKYNNSVPLHIIITDNRSYDAEVVRARLKRVDAKYLFNTHACLKAGKRPFKLRKIRFQSGRKMRILKIYHEGLKAAFKQLRSQQAAYRKL